MISSHARLADLTIVGDVMPGRGVAAAIVRAGAELAARRVRSLLRANVVVGNLECPLTRSQQLVAGKPAVPASAAAWLRLAGFDVLNLANNHVMDAGPRGLADTLEVLQEVGIKTLGAGMNLADAVRPLVVPCGNQQAAFLSFGNGPPATRSSPGVAPFDSLALARGLEQVPPEVAVTVVLVHIGLKFLEYPESWLRRFAHEALARGGEFVVGCHPHCLRGVQRTTHGTIVYSLGDFLMDTSDRTVLREQVERSAAGALGFAPPDTGELCRRSLCVDLFLDGRQVPECQLRPVVIGQDLLPRRANPQERATILQHVRQLSRPLDDPRSPPMREVRRIESVYRQRYMGGRLSRLLRLPLRARPSRVVNFLEICRLAAWSPS